MATVADVVFASKIVREVQMTAFLPMRVGRIRGSLAFVGWADASEATDEAGKAVGGYLITCAPAHVLEGAERNFNVLSWCCKRLPRVARSNEAAEIQAMAECQDELDWRRLDWSEMCGPPLDLNKPGESVSRIPGALVTDAAAFYDAVNARVGRPGSSKQAGGDRGHANPGELHGEQHRDALGEQRRDAR